ncbi:hypothetical protein NC653_014790 [Populus alba x Populus x berolinensis]|uniref:FHA domain-containing protein n=1 Tax=Populus alba x Populus x berolinensis TaxID=444605 RepID=A0AAD6QYY4_9ROSI|nr:hypothetical protein NC653_014790 [Populus alba x Populus x berolinensis]
MLAMNMSSYPDNARLEIQLQITLFHQKSNLEHHSIMLFQKLWIVDPAHKAFDTQFQNTISRRTTNGGKTIYMNTFPCIRCVENLSNTESQALWLREFSQQLAGEMMILRYMSCSNFDGKEVLQSPVPDRGYVISQFGVPISLFHEMPMWRMDENIAASVLRKTIQYQIPAEATLSRVMMMEPVFFQTLKQCRQDISMKDMNRAINKAGAGYYLVEQQKMLLSTLNLGREGRANKISRRQATINLDKIGSFYLKNLGKCSLSVNDKEIAPGQSLSLSSGCLIEIRGMPFIFEINQTCVKQYLAKKNQTQEHLV